MVEIDTSNLLDLMDGVDEFTQLRAYAGDVLFTEKMAGNQVYLIKEGQVDLYLMREERRVVVDTLGKGQCFGMNSRLLHCRRPTHAMARTYSEFYVVDGATLERHLKATPQLIESLLHTQAARIDRANELIATKVNYQPELQAYAHLLQILGQADLAGRAGEAQRRGEPATVAHVLLSEFQGHARALLGHSDPHIRQVLGRLESLHLLHHEGDRARDRKLVFSPKNIVDQARKLTESDPHRGKLDFEYLSVDELSTMVNVDRHTLLSKLAQSEFSDELITFRKSEVVRLLDAKGRRFFADRKIKTPSEFTDILDIEFATQKALVSALARVDAFDLAKLMSTIEVSAIRDRILACLPRAKREEVLSESADIGQVDTVEILQLEQLIIKQLRELMLPALA